LPPLLGGPGARGPGSLNRLNPRATYRAISDYFLKLNVDFFSHWRLEAHIPLHYHPKYWWGHSHWCSHQPKYWWGYVPGIPSGVDAYGPILLKVINNILLNMITQDKIHYVTA